MSDAEGAYRESRLRYQQLPPDAWSGSLTVDPSTKRSTPSPRRGFSGILQTMAVLMTATLLVAVTEAQDVASKYNSRGKHIGAHSSLLSVEKGSTSSAMQ